MSKLMSICVSSSKYHDITQPVKFGCEPCSFLAFSVYICILLIVGKLELISSQLLIWEGLLC